MGEAMTWTDAAWIILVANSIMMLLSIGLAIGVCRYTNKNMSEK